MARSGPTLVYICNPNNPTGTLTPSREVESWIREARDGVVFLVDEAYFEARACLGDADWVRTSLSGNEEARRITYTVLDELGLERLPSHTNFVMHRVPGDVRDYRRRMAERGVRVGRPFPPMTGYNRLSFGRPREMERFAGILRRARREGWV